MENGQKPPSVREVARLARDGGREHTPKTTYEQKKAPTVSELLQKLRTVLKSP